MNSVRIDTESFHIEVDPDGGFFEHHRVGDEWGGGLWFEGKVLVDYDGVFELPPEVITALEMEGYDMGYAKDDEAHGGRHGWLLRKRPL